MDRRWFPARICHRDDRLGLWPCKALADGPDQEALERYLLTRQAEGASSAEIQQALWPLSERAMQRGLKALASVQLIESRGKGPAIRWYAVGRQLHEERAARLRE